MSHFTSGHPEWKQTTIIWSGLLRNLTSFGTEKTTCTQGVNRKTEMIIAFWKQFTDKFLFPWEKTADIIDKSLGIG
jgi:hypothetical protein